MKTFKKITSIMLVLTMLFALACTVLADDVEPTPLTPAAVSSTNDDNGVIIIDNALPGEEYSIYQIFVLESFTDPDPENPLDGSYSYTVAEAWKDFFKAVEVDGVTNEQGLAWVDVSEEGFVTWKEGKASASDLQEFATAALAWAKENAVVASGNETAAEAVAPATTSTVTFNGLNLGYYLVTSSVGTICSLDTTNKIVKIDEKNPASTIDKKVENESYDIGEAVPFTITVTVNKVTVAGAEEADVNGYVNDVKIVDTMTDGFTFTQDDLDALTVTVKRGDETVTLDPAPVKTLTTAEGATNSSFEITFSNGTIMYGDEITVEYQAVLNEKAVIGTKENNEGKSNLNKAELSYGANQHFEDTEDVYTGEIVIKKYDGKTEDRLPGAIFVLSRKNGETTEYYKANEGYTSENGTVVPSKVTWVTDIDAATKVTTDAEGLAEFNGIAAGNYQLVEIKAPAGYNKLTAPVDVTVYKITDVAEPAEGDEEGDAEVEETTKVAYHTEVDVPNSTGLELPSTGGMGTTIFIAIGAVMLVGTGILLVTKRRMSLIED